MVTSIQSPDIRVKAIKAIKTRIAGCLVAISDSHLKQLPHFNKYDGDPFVEMSIFRAVDMNATQAWNFIQGFDYFAFVDTTVYLF